MADDTRRDVLSAAYDKMEASTTDTTPTPATVETTRTEAPAPAEASTTSAPQDGAASPSAAQRERDDRGRFAPTTTEKPAAAPKGAEKAETGTAAAAVQGKGPGAGSAAVPAPQPVETPKTADLRAPQSWRPTAREKWTGLPREVQEEAIRIDREVQKTLSEAAETRRFRDRFQQAVAPHEAHLRSSGQDPVAVFANTLPTIIALGDRNPAVRAQKLAEIVRAVLPGEEGINLLASAIDGKGPAAQPQMDPAAVAAQAEERVMSRLQRQAAQVAAQRQQAMLDKFSEARPFFEDVRGRMGDILAARGTPNPTEQELGEVYDLACSLDPEINRILEQRKAAKAAETAGAAIQRTQAAASSVRSTPAGAAPAAKPKGRMAVLEAAYDEMSRSR
jgi:hypothetical protein